MALFIKTTFFFKNSIGGWSESWHNLVAGSLTTAEQQARPAAMLRLATCGLGTILAGVRVSDQDAEPKRSRMVDMIGNGLGMKEMPATPALTGYSSTDDRSADALQSCLLLQCLTTTGARKSLFMAGVPDFIIRTNPNGPNTEEGTVWLSKFQLWRAEFQSGRWGFRTRRRIGADVQPQTIIGYQLQAGGLSRVGLIVNDGGPVYGVGKRLQIRHATVINPALRNILGTWVVESKQAGTQANTTVYYLKGTEGINPSNIFFPGDVRLVDFEGLAVTDIRIVKQASHKRGGFFGQFRGRVSKPKRV